MMTTNLSNLNLSDIDIPDVDIPDVDIPDIDIPDVDIPDIDTPDINIPDVDIPDDAITLEVTNTQNTNTIDESDGLSLYEAIIIANNDPENNYIIEIPSGSSGDFLTLLNSTPSNNSNADALGLTGGTAQIAYVAYYGRPADNGGLDFWNDALSTNEVSYAPRGGDPLTGSEQDVYDQIVNDFGNSEESDRIFGTMSNRERVNRVYQFAFDRDGDEEGLNFWTEQLDLGNVTLANFALEVALGARNEDIIILNNKIESANLFSESIDTPQEIDAYSGSSGESFGREWLNDFGGTTSSQEEVDSVINDLVNDL